MPRRHLDKCIYIPENGVSPGLLSPPRSRRPSIPIQAIFVGRLVPYKGADILVEAAAPLVRAGQLTVRIVGDGPQRAQLEDQIRKDGLSDGLQLAGWLGHDEVQRHLAEADLLVFPSIREFGGGVALEAMAAGAVPMVVNYGGLGELVTAETGILVELADRATLVIRFREELAKVIADPESLQVRSLKAHARVNELFTWDAKAQQILEVYRWVLRQRESRPSWGIPF
jgi:glycosyltransferase involved in cell wall biosynthesis